MFDIFDALALIGGLCLFLFGMNVMGDGLERRAGNSLKALLGKLTDSKLKGFLTGMGVTAVIQSSSATTVMVVGFVNSKVMTLKQSIGVIMGANIGTTVTSWLLSLGGISSDNIIMKLLKPMSFTPILALIGIAFTMFSKSSKKKDVGTILLGFATLMFGMDAMSDAVKGLAEVPEFQNLFLAFTNPILGVLVGALVTAIIQSSSASVGILQALSVTGAVSYSAAIPIIMGQNIGTCVTAMLSSVGATKNAKRAAIVHLSFNIIGTVILLCVFSVVKIVLAPAFLMEGASLFGIAVCHSIFNVACTLILLPMAGFLEFLANKIVPDSKTPETMEELDERLLVTPPIALNRCRQVSVEMAETAIDALKEALFALGGFTPEQAEAIREKEEKTDHYEDILGSYLVKLSGRELSEDDHDEVTKLLKLISDFERISDHAINIVGHGNGRIKKPTYIEEELKQLQELLNNNFNILMSSGLDEEGYQKIEEFEQQIDDLTAIYRQNQINRLSEGKIDAADCVKYSQVMTDIERVSDHMLNIVEECIKNQFTFRVE